jgi:hypothetical protein
LGALADKGVSSDTQTHNLVAGFTISIEEAAELALVKCHIQILINRTITMTN